MKRVGRWVMLALSGVLLGLAVSPIVIHRAQAAALQQRYAQAAMSVENKQLLSLVNKVRSGNNVMPLIYSSLLSESADYKARDMASRSYFGHLAPDSDDKNGIDKAIDLTGTHCVSISENLYQGVKHNSPKAAVQAWLNSPSHRAALLDPNSQEVGLGIDDGYYVLHFCSVH